MPVYKDEKRGTWYVSTYVEYKDGTKKRVMKRGFKTKREAKEFENDLVFQSTMDTSDNYNFDDVAKEYLEWYKSRRKESSYRKVESLINVRLIPYFRKKKIKEITRRDVVKMQNKMLDKYSVSGAKRTHTMLSTILNYAITMEYISNNVAREVGNIQSTQPKNINYWTLSEFKTFISHVDNTMYKSFFMCLFFGGFRKGELLAINWKDINFKNNTIDINKTATRNKITTPKNESSIRVVKMPNHTINLLRQLKLKVKPKEDYFVFGEYYRHIHETTVDRWYDKYIKSSGVQRIRIHDFRHSHASYLINNKHDIQIVSKRLGHTDVSTTLDIYSHLYPNKEEDAVEQMEKDFTTADLVKLIN